MKGISKLLLLGLSLLFLAACSNDEPTNESKNDENKTDSTETAVANEEQNSNENETSNDLFGYWEEDLSGNHISINEIEDNVYSLKILGYLELLLEPTNVEENVINTKLIEVLNAENVGWDEERIQEELPQGKEFQLELSDNHEKLTLNLFGNPAELTKIDNTLSVEPSDLAGNWKDNNEEITSITEENGVIVLSFEDEVDEGILQFEFSVEITDVVGNMIYGEITKILPEKYANYDSHLTVGSLMVFQLSEDSSKLSIMGSSEMTRVN